MGGGGQWEEGSINGLKNLLLKQGVSPTPNLGIWRKQRKHAKGLPLRSRNQGGEGGGGDCCFSVLSFGELLTLKTMCLCITLLKMGI